MPTIASEANTPVTVLPSTADVPSIGGACRLGLPAVSQDLGIVGHGATQQRSNAPGTPKFANIQVGSGVFSRDVIYGNRAGGGGIDDADPSLSRTVRFSAITPARAAGSYPRRRYDDVNRHFHPGKQRGRWRRDLRRRSKPQSCLQLTNDTITGNYASTDGGGIHNLAGAMPIGSLALAHTRISRNDAGCAGVASTMRGLWPPLTLRSAVTPHAEGGIYQAVGGDGSGATLTSSAVLHNIPDNCEPPGTIMG